MTTIRMIWRKMVNTKWLVTSWLVGILITVALISQIPIYTDGALQHLLVKDLEAAQVQSGNYPGGLFDVVTFQSPSMKKSVDPRKLYQVEDYFYKTIPGKMRLPIQTSHTELDSISLNVSSGTPTSSQNDASAGPVTLTITSMTDLEKHIKLTAGRMPSLHPVNGVYEVLVPETTVSQMGLLLNQNLTVTPSDSSVSGKIVIRPVGVFKQSMDRDLYWRSALDAYNQNVFLPDSVFRQTFVDGKLPWLQYGNLYTAFDYHQIHMGDLDRISQVQPALQTYAVSLFGSGNSLTDFPVDDQLPIYMDKRQQLTLLEWSLYIPVLVMLAFYNSMVARLIVDRERNEIAVLRSRGAQRGQIFFSYLFEVLILSAIAVVLGPVIGLGLTELLGASSGFLEFVSRTALPVHLSRQAYEYALAAVGFCIVMTMVPVLLATRSTIVSHKQEMARANGSAVWHKYFLDVVLLGVSWYGWHVLQQTHAQQMQTNMDITNGLQIDPLSFCVPSLFVLGLGLLLLRVYPWIIRFVSWLAARYYPVTMHLSFMQVGRSLRQYQFLMIFLVMTIAVGTFSASTARTINGNLEDQIRYSTGADISIQERWQSTQTTTSSGTKVVHYEEPPFFKFPALPGVDHAARVFQQDQVSVQANSGNSTSETQLMAIDPPDFAQTAWFKPQLLPYHWWNYLNMLSSDPSGAIISTSLAKQLDVTPGQSITVKWDGSRTAQFTVYATVDYWPSWNPYDTSLQSNQSEPPTLIVANLPYVQNAMGLEPYQVWLKLKPTASSETLYNALAKENIPVISLDNVRQDIIQLKKSPYILCLNGSLTLGFLISTAITLVGFLLYWLLTLSARKLQFGVFRAVGMSRLRLITMLVWEQLLTSGVACILGGGIGIATSRIFVSQFQLYFSTKSQVPPFQVIFANQDGYRLYGFVLAMLLIGVAFIWWLLMKLKIHQAIRLGEDG